MGGSAALLIAGVRLEAYLDSMERFADSISKTQYTPTLDWTQRSGPSVFLTRREDFQGCAT